MTRTLFAFHGGLHRPRTNQSTARLSRAPLPQRLYLPLQQHIGAPAEPV